MLPAASRAVVKSTRLISCRGARNARCGLRYKSTSTGKSGEEKIFWSNPRDLSKISEEMLYSLPPPMKTPIPETFEERRWKIIKSWAPLFITVTIAGVWYVRAKTRPPGEEGVDLDKVPDFLRNALEARQREKAAQVANSGTSQPSISQPQASNTPTPQTPQQK